METNVQGYRQITYRDLNRNQKIFALAAIFALMVGISLMVYFLPNGKQIKPYPKMGLVVNGKIIDTKNAPIIINGVPLVSVDDIKNTIDKNIFFDSKNSKVIITTQDEVIRIKADKNAGVNNNNIFTLNTNMKVQDGVAYVPITEFKDLYNIDVNYIKENNVVYIDDKSVDAKMGVSRYNNSAIRVLPVAQDLSKVRFIKQPILKKVKKGESLRIYEEVNGWYKVRTGDGTDGVIQKRYITKINTQKGTPKKAPQYQVWKPADGKINLTWEQIENTTPVMDNVEKVDGLDIVAPTWFDIKDASGNITNKGDAAYVSWAKANGYKIWGVVRNNFNDRAATSKFLGDSNAREKAINNIVSLAQYYGLDGINMDIEYVNVKDKDLLVQFARELAPLCRIKGLVCSEDVTVKVAGNDGMFYDRKALGEAVDYVILMSYDQYWSTSQKSGPVAGYNWVDSSIAETLKEVPKEKLIMGLPFYVRQWQETGGKVSSKTLTMPGVQNVVRQYGAKVEWDKENGQNYAQFTKGNSVFKIWIEDEKSINLKSSLVLKYDIVGAASWRRGYETYDTWGVLKNNLKTLKSYDEWNKAQSQ